MFEGEGKKCMADRLHQVASGLTGALNFRRFFPKSKQQLFQVIGNGALNALFFASDAPLPDSDPECDPPVDAWLILTLMAHLTSDCSSTSLFLAISCYFDS